MYSEGFLPAAFLVIIYGRTQVSPTGWYEAKTTVGANCGLPQITGNKPSPSAIAATSPGVRGVKWISSFSDEEKRSKKVVGDYYRDGVPNPATLLGMRENKRLFS